MPASNRHSRSRILILTAALGLLAPLGLANSSTAATPAGSTQAAAASTAAAADPQTLFATSFEAGDPQPDWESTVETGPDGEPMTANVEGIRDTGLPGDISEHIVEVTASAENTGGGEVAENAVDGDINTKWLAFEPTGWLQVRLDQPIKVVKYALGSANDAPGRDPKDWTLQGSNDGQTWTDIDRRTGEDFPERFQLREFDITNDMAYSRYRLDITANSGDGLTQLAEWQLSDGSPPEPPSPNMDTRLDDGPSSTYTAKSKVGFTGVQSLEYGGTVTSEEGGYSYNKVLDVDIPVGDVTELRYVLFPEFGTEDDLRYPSTFAAVDLAFTDGTYLSDLEATDQNGFELSPLGQGRSKTPYTNQWNLRRTNVGAAAAGKTIDRILVGYEFPQGRAAFHGWIDDITISDASTQPTGDSPAEWVTTRRGTNSTGSFSRGNNIPATAMPHGFNFWAPVTNASSLSWIYEYQRRNDDQNRPRLEALSLSHETSPWMGDRQTFQVMPSAQSGEPATGKRARSLAFSHDDEEARPYYYGVDFANGVSAETAPTDHAAIMRFGFPDDNAALVFDNVDEDTAGLRIHPDQGTITGWTDTRSGLSNGATRMFVYAEFDDPMTASSASGRTGWARFDAGDDGAVNMRIATSLISLDQAKHNLELEISDDATVESVSADAKAAWDDMLDVIEVEGATPEQLTTLYSGLYRLFLYPNSAYENTGTNEAPVYKHAVQSSESNDIPAGTTETQTGAEVVDGKVYVNNGFWDTYRTTWAAYSLLTPSDAGEMVDGFVQQYRDGGWVARWSSPGYANLMTGTSSDVAFADAAVKGVPGIDLEDTYDAAVKNATALPPGGNNPNIGRKGMVNSQFLGWVPDNIGEGVSWALEGYINDYGIANMADMLAERATSPAQRQRYHDEAAYFRQRALNYVHMFDDRVGFFQGRDAAGEWKSDPEEYDPRVWGHDHDYTETDGWNFAFHVPHDGRGLANLYGGRQGLADKLDEFYATPETAKFTGSYGGVIHEMIEARDVRMGQWGFSNQVSHHIPWMYTYTGQPYKTQAITREVLSRMYQGSEIGQGYAGDEDNGETSAWYIFAALGIYPLQMGSENYVIGSPLFTKATVHLENGEELVVNAPDNGAENVYVQGLTVDGEAHDQTYISHDVLADGAVLDFDMGSEPSDWGTGPDAAPPSITDDDSKPRPMHDATGPGRGTGSASGDADVSGLFDNTSATDASLPAGSWVQYRFREDARRQVRFYTLTSAGDGTADPSSWVVTGSNDGRTWTVLDQRVGEAFQWEVQTRPFRMARPGTYSRYRIEFADGSSIRLSELELLTSQQALTSPVSAEVDSGVAWPGETVPVAVTVSNSGARASGQVGLTVPDGWSVEPASADFALARGESTTLSFDVTVPEGTEPGGYDVEATVTSNRGGAVAVGAFQVVGDTIEFTPGTAAEVPWLFDADGSQLDGAVYDGNARFTDGSNYAIYRFRFPSDVTGGVLNLDLHNQFLIQTSTDGESWQTVLEETRNIRDGSNRGWRSLDLNELRGDSDVLYVRLGDSQPADGWGGWLARVRLELQR